MLGRRLLGNSLSILVTRLTQSIATFVLSASIARILGPYELGQYLLAFGLYFIFMSLASQGFKVLFTRELSRNPDETPTYLVSGTLLQLFFCFVGYAMLAGLIFILPYKPDTSMVCYVMGLAIFPFAISNITESVFQAKEKMYLITISTVPIYILRLVVMIWAMRAGYGVVDLAIITVISEALILLIEWGLVLRMVTPKWKISWEFIRTALKSVRTFIAIEGVAVINTRMQLLILSLIGGEIVVGLYGSIVQLMQPFDILSSSLTVGVFPSMTKTVGLGLRKQRQLSERIIEMLCFVALPITIGMPFFGGDLLALVYQKSDFSAAAIPLCIVSLGLMASAFSRPLSYLLVANHFEKINMREVLTTTITASVMGFFLVSRFGLMGAAFSVLFMRLSSCTQYVYAVCVNLFTLRFWRIMRRPVLVNGLMMLVFWLLKHSGSHIAVVLLVSTGVYALLLGSVVIFNLGGPKVAYAKLLQR